jgi:hypothetical protein
MAKRKESGVITRRAGRRPNSLKHGAFSASEVLPGEDPREFEDLVNAVFAEWDPSGPVEEDAARSIASAIWRKSGLNTFDRAQRARAFYDGILKGTLNDNKKEYFAQTTAFVNVVTSAKWRCEVLDLNEKLEKIIKK